MLCSIDHMTSIAWHGWGNLSPSETSRQEEHLPQGQAGVTTSPPRACFSGTRKAPSGTGASLGKSRQEGWQPAILISRLMATGFRYFGLGTWQPAILTSRLWAVGLRHLGLGTWRPAKLIFEPSAKASAGANNTRKHVGSAGNEFGWMG